MNYTRSLTLLLAAGILAGCASGAPRQSPAPIYGDDPNGGYSSNNSRRQPAAPIYDSNGRDGRNDSISVQTPQTYQVQRGDTLYSIARKYNVSRQDVLDLNDLNPDDPLQPGQVLVLPVDDNQRAAPQPDIVLNQPTATVPTKTRPRVTRTGVVNETVAVEPTPNRRNNRDSAGNRNNRDNTSNRNNSNNRDNSNRSNRNTGATMAASTCPNPADEDVNWVNPAEGELLSEFSENSNQKGLEIAGDFGDAVVATADGEVVYSGTGLRGYGKLILIKHNSTYMSAYAHNRKLLVKLGDKVTQGQQIAEMGNTDASRVELYFELRRCGKAVDPRQYLPLK